MPTQSTTHAGPTNRPITLTGAHLFRVTANASDGQTSTIVVAADDKWKAQTRHMSVDTEMRIMGQMMTYDTEQIA